MRKCFLFVALLFVLASIRIPCAKCYPPGGTDSFKITATLDWDLDGILASETVSLTGPVIVTRGDPYDPGDGRTKVDIEIVSMSLTGISPALGPITIVESPKETSEGYFEQLDAGIDFPAFFATYPGMYLAIQTPLSYPLSTLYSGVLVMLEFWNQMDNWPPWGEYFIPLNPGTHLVDEEGIEVGWMWFSFEVEPEPVGLVGGMTASICTRGVLNAYIGFSTTIIAAVVIVSIYIKRIKQRG